MSYSSIVFCTAVTRVQARSMIFACGVIVGSRIGVVTNVHATQLEVV